ncbi:T9SS type A sorting domain-containing protein [Longitalea luteola]|uniref:T9SS type A sorting domain-containing protein n=1 Tax=Longitalea luteola TaxID=2812563 RepID=UPI001A97CF4E|nr:T9SS type A sorting domain-containing protein [Longitalea luteola]
MSTLPQPDRLNKRLERITVYPTLVSQKKFWLQLYNIEQCVFTVHLYSLSGQQVFKHFLNHTDLHSTHTIQLPWDIPRGIYKVAIRYGDTHYVQPIVID